MRKVLLGMATALVFLNCCKLTVSADAGFTKFLHETEIEVTVDAGFTEFLQNIEPEEITCTEYIVPEYSGFKSFMSYRLFGRNTLQYKLQQQATTDVQGFRKIEDYYIIAVGSCFDAQIGQRVDLKLKNGEVIKCVIGDQKADKDTDQSNMFSKNNCLSEFLVDIRTLNKTVKDRGDVSHFPEEEWNSPVTEVIVYEEFLLED